MLYAGIVIIFNKKGEVLIVKRSPACETFAEHWCFPGGTADEGEDSIGCAIREVFEETTLKIKPEDLTYIFTLTKETDKDIYFYVTDKYKGDIKLDWESMDFKWTPARVIRNERFIPTPDILFELIELWADKFISNED